MDVEVRQVENSWWRVAAWHEIEGAMIYGHTFGLIREVQRLAWQWRPSFGVMRRFGQALERCGVESESELGRFVVVARDDVGLHLSVSEGQFGPIERSRFPCFSSGAAG